MDDDDAISEVSEAFARSVMSDSDAGQSVARTNTQTVSEIFPHDSISNRNFATSGAKRGDKGEAGGSAASTAPSVVSFHSSADGYLYKVIDGRAYNSQSDHYALPADDDEHSRLDMQHFAQCLTMDCLYPFKNLVRHVITRNQGKATPYIMDMGAGSGRWAVDMSTAFKDAQVVGVDLVPPALLMKEQIPDNCRFEIDDANLSMEHYANSFDLVHARSIDTGLNDTQSFMYEMARILKPGGVLILGRGDAQFWDENFKPLPFTEPGQPGFTWLQYITGHAYRAYLDRGSTAVNGGLFWKEWFEKNPNYSKVYVQDTFVPLGPWQPNLNDRQRLASNLMREDMARVYVAFRRMLLAAGFEERYIDKLIEETTTELRELKIRAYFRFTFTAAVRTDAPWQERQDMPDPDELQSRCLLRGFDIKTSLINERRVPPPPENDGASRSGAPSEMSVQSMSHANFFEYWRW